MSSPVWNRRRLNLTWRRVRKELDRAPLGSLVVVHGAGMTIRARQYYGEDS